MPQDRVRITFTDFTGSKHADVTLRLDLTAEQVIDRLKQADFLPSDVGPGQVYILSLKRTDTQIAPNQTLRSAGVREGDTVIAAVQTRGGVAP